MAGRLGTGTQFSVHLLQHCNSCCRILIIKQLRTRGKIYPFVNIIPFEANENFCSFMKRWYFIGLQIALKKNYYGFVAGGLKSCVEERQPLLCWNEWIFYVTVPNGQWINDFLTQTAQFANCEGWGAKISGKAAEARVLWELGSTEMDVQRVHFQSLHEILFLWLRGTLFSCIS